MELLYSPLLCKALLQRNGAVLQLGWEPGEQGRLGNGIGLSKNKLILSTLAPQELQVSARTGPLGSATSLSYCDAQILTNSKGSVRLVQRCF